MERQEILTIQDLVNDQNFRRKVLKLKSDKKLPQSLQSQFKGISVSNLEMARQIVISLDQNAKSFNSTNKDQIWSNVIKAADEFDCTSGTSNNQNPFSVTRKPSRLKSYAKYVAVFISGLMALTWVMLSKPYEYPDKEQAQVIIKSNLSGQKSRIQLVDGSVVHLNAESELQYSEEFSGKERKIYLKGEAYFEVAKDKSRPFTVVSNNISVTALGTEFNINAFEENIQVALLEGSVSVHNTNNSDQLVLKPKEVVRFDSRSKELQMIDANASDLATWRNRIIYFDNTPMDEAVEVLSRWYAVDIEVKNLPQEELTCSGKFKNSSLELLLKNLSYTLDFQYEIKGKSVLLNFENDAYE